MTDIDSDTLLNALKKRIPGYGAYVEQEARRGDDRLTRGFLAKRLSEAVRTIDEVGAKAVDSGDFELPHALEKLRHGIELARSRLSAAVEGYSSWFGDRTVNADLLKQVATLDSNLVGLVDQINELAGKLLDRESNAKAELQEAIDLLLARIDRRQEMIKQGA